MRPPLISEELIKAAIREAAAQSGRVTGVAVRAILARRHGNRGGVARIYRVIAASQQAAHQVAPALHRPLTSSESQQAAIERANLAEHREQVHQARWARETDALRARATDAERSVRDLDEARLRVAELSRALASAQQRIALLEHQATRMAT